MTAKKAAPAAEAHDFSVETSLGFRLCTRCGSADLAEVRDKPCQPLPEAEAKEIVERKINWCRRFRGLAPFARKEGSA